jgi:hypothetical protein
MLIDLSKHEHFNEKKIMFKINLLSAICRCTLSYEVSLNYQLYMPLVVSCPFHFYIKNLCEGIWFCCIKNYI